MKGQKGMKTKQGPSINPKQMAKKAMKQGMGFK